jgi:tetratricopeptide (TPR) repeat protein
VKPPKSFATLYAFVTAAVCVSGCNQTTPEEHLLRGNVFQHDDDHAKAVEEYSEAISLAPNFREAYVRRAESWKSTKSFKHAIADLTKALQLDADDPISYRNRGSYQLFLGDNDQAISDYSKAIELKPDGETYRYRGYAFVKKGEFPQAIEDYGEAIRLAPDDATNFYMRAAALRNAGDLDKALADCEEALRLSPDSGQALHQRGLVWLGKQEFQRAVEDFTRGIEQWPDSPLSFQHRADAYDGLGEHEKAAADRKEVERLGVK